MLCIPIKRRLISLSPSSESLAPSSDSFVNPMNAVTLPCTAAILSAIFEFVIGCVKQLQLCALSLRTIQQKKTEVSVLINGWVTANYSVSQPPFVHHLGIFIYRICVKLLQLIYDVIAHNSVKNEVSLLINGWVTAKYSVSRPSFCPPSWNLQSDLCKTLIGYVRYHSVQFKRKTASLSQTVVLRSTNEAYTHHTHKRGIHTRTHARTHAHTHTRRWHKVKCNALHFA